MRIDERPQAVSCSVAPSREDATSRLLPSLLAELLLNDRSENRESDEDSGDRQ